MRNVIAVLVEWLGINVVNLRGSFGKIFIGEGIGIIVLKKSELVKGEDGVKRRKSKELGKEEYFEFLRDDLKKLDRRMGKENIYKKVLLVIMEGNEIINWIDLRGVNSLNGYVPIVVFLENINCKIKNIYRKDKVNGESIKVGEKEFWSVKWLRNKGIEIGGKVFKMKNREELDNSEIELRGVA